MNTEHQTPTSADHARLLTLERSLRRTKATLALVVATAVLAVGVGMSRQPEAPAVPDVIQARAFEVVDADNRVLLQLLASANGGRVTVHNSAGTIVASLGLVDDGDGVALLSNRQGNEMVYLGTDSQGHVGIIRTYHRSGIKQTEAASISGRSEGYFAVFNEDGKLGAGLLVPDE